MIAGPAIWLVGVGAWVEQRLRRLHSPAPTAIDMEAAASRALYPARDLVVLPVEVRRQ